ncbi:PAS domain-containing sensor histidine kinase [Desulforhabdus sp. TSK]|uniref:sensor histidine kinase n=1 Tax=Desulforhabdus sp. TSK TaxID=2925014 RepID=UPI001FC8BA0C|nr:ATP-binding protein [Desulforhabdus sp. TSK]GKT08060.1 hypothetical protein DSTSK_13650 [Desulforhabdus sp. TSK]
MKERPRMPSLEAFGKPKPRFLQPVAMALVFLLFVMLFFAMAMLDLRRVEDLLLKTLKNKAHYVFEVTQKAFQEKFNRLVQSDEGLHGPFAGFSPEDDSTSLRETLVNALLNAARAVDLQEAKHPEGVDGLQALTLPEHFQALLLVDGQGNPLYQKGPVPPHLLKKAASLAQGSNEIVLHLFQGISREDYLGFVGIRRKKSEGAVFLVLNRKDLMAWAWNIAVQNSMEHMQLGRGVVYFAVEDRSGRLLAQAGSVSVESLEQCIFSTQVVGGSSNPAGQCVQMGEAQFLEFSMPMILENEVFGTMRIGMETLETDQILLENRQHILLWTGLMLLIGLLAMGLLYQTQNHHISRMQTMRERLYQAEKLSALGKLGAGVAHEIRNPLNAISLAVQRIRRDFGPETQEKREAYERITRILRDEIKRLNTIIEEFLGLSRTSRLELRPQPVVLLLERILSLVQEEAKSRNIEIRKRWAEGNHTVLMDIHKLEQALLNIIGNAVESIPGDGMIFVSCEEPSKGVVCIRIRDSGTGIPAGEERKIFDPFYTTKEKGTGLGLAIASEIITAHGGEIRVTSKPKLGSVFEILLPRATGNA